MATHTPGPWRASWGRYLPIIAIVNGKDAQIGRAESFGQISDEECEANARLIAAAPELLAAVKALRDGAYGNPSYPVENDQIDEAADAAIAKAEGRV